MVYTGILIILPGFEEATEYWVRLRIKNSVGETKWTGAMKVLTPGDEENVDDEDVKEDEDIKVNNSSPSSPPDEEQDESSDTVDDDSLITSTTEAPVLSDDSGKFYGLFFGVGAVLLIVACTFLMRMV